MNTLARGGELKPDSYLPPPDTVLIAEDDPIFRRVLENWLKKWNYRVTSLENGLDAWSALQQEGCSPDGDSGLDDAGPGRH